MYFTSRVLGYPAVLILVGPVTKFQLRTLHVISITLYAVLVVFRICKST